MMSQGGEDDFEMEAAFAEEEVRRWSYSQNQSTANIPVPTVAILNNHNDSCSIPGITSEEQIQEKLRSIRSLLGLSEQRNPHPIPSRLGETFGKEKLSSVSSSNKRENSAVSNEFNRNPPYKLTVEDDDASSIGTATEVSAQKIDTNRFLNEYIDNFQDNFEIPDDLSRQKLNEKKKINAVAATAERGQNFAQPQANFAEESSRPQVGGGVNPNIFKRKDSSSYDDTSQFLLQPSEQEQQPPPRDVSMKVQQDEWRIHLQKQQQHQQLSEQSLITHSHISSHDHSSSASVLLEQLRHNSANHSTHQQAQLQLKKQQQQQQLQQHEQQLQQQQQNSSQLQQLQHFIDGEKVISDIQSRKKEIKADVQDAYYTSNHSNTGTSSFIHAQTKGRVYEDVQNSQATSKANANVNTSNINASKINNSEEESYLQVAKQSQKDQASVLLKSNRVKAMRTSTVAVDEQAAASEHSLRADLQTRLSKAMEESSNRDEFDTYQTSLNELRVELAAKANSEMLLRQKLAATMTDAAIREEEHQSQIDSLAIQVNQMRTSRDILSQGDEIQVSQRFLEMEMELHMLRGHIEQMAQEKVQLMTDLETVKKELVNSNENSLARLVFAHDQEVNQLRFIINHLKADIETLINAGYAPPPPSQGSSKLKSKQTQQSPHQSKRSVPLDIIADRNIQAEGRFRAEEELAFLKLKTRGKHYMDLRIEALVYERKSFALTDAMIFWKSAFFSVINRLRNQTASILEDNEAMKASLTATAKKHSAEAQQTVIKLTERFHEELRYKEEELAAFKEKLMNTQAKLSDMRVKSTSSNSNFPADSTITCTEQQRTQRFTTQQVFNNKPSSQAAAAATTRHSLKRN